MWTPLLLLVSFVTHPAQAQRPAAAPFESRLQKVQERCLNDSRAVQSHTIKSVAELGYSQDWLDLSLKLIGKPVHYGVDGVRHVTRSRMGNQADQAKLDRVDQAIRDFVSAHPQMDSFQKACIATCASTQIIDYSDWSFDDIEVAATIVGKGQGLCRHFSDVADHFMSQVGVSSRVAAGHAGKGDHAWISVRVDGHRYWMEPQHDDCVFYKK